MNNRQKLAELESLVEMTGKCIDSYSLSIEKAREKAGRKDFTLLFSNENQGFIAGYRDFENPEIMFIWLFGVLPENRGRGVGSRLLQEFERSAIKKGYKKIRSYTFNKYKSKIILSLNRGYRIIEARFDETVRDYLILLEKIL